MTAGAHYRLDQAANAIPTGTTDVARTDLRYGSVMHLVGDSSSGQTSPAWTITAWPSGSARAQPTNATTFDATYTPDVPGSYAGQFLVGDGIAGNRRDFIFACTLDANGLIVDDGVREPAFGEKVGDDNSNSNDRGYAKPYEGAIANIVPVVTSLANLRNRRANRQKMVYLDIVTGAGHFAWDAASTVADDSGWTTVQPGFGTGAALATGRWRRVGQAPSQVVMDPSIGSNYAINSFCPRKLTSAKWRNLPGTTFAATMSLRPRAGTIDNPNDADQLNPEKNATGNGETDCAFTPGLGVTAVAFKVRAKMNVGDSNTAIRLAIKDSNGVTVLASTSGSDPVLTQTAQTCTLSLSGMTSGHLYYLSIQCNASGQQCNPLIGDITVEPTAGGTGVFADPFVRVEIVPTLVPGNLDPHWISGIFFVQGPLSDIPFRTDAASFAVEAYQFGAGGTGKLFYFANGETQEGGTLPDATLTVESVTVGAQSGPRREIACAVRTGPAAAVATGGTHVTAIYVSTKATLKFLPPAGPKMVIYGDSISNELSASKPGLNGWVSFMRKRWPGIVTVEARPSRKLQDDCATSDTARTFALYLCRNKPDIIWIPIGVNDYAAGTAAATFGGWYECLVDNCILYSNALIVCQSTLNKTSNGANGAGSTLADFDTQIQTIANDASRAGRCLYVNAKGAGWPVSPGDLADGTHPNDSGSAKYGGQALIVLASAGRG